MKKVFLLLTAVITLAACNKDVIEGLEADVLSLESIVQNLAAQISANADYILDVDTQTAVAATAITNQVVALNNLVSNLADVDADLQVTIDQLSNDLSVAEDALIQNIDAVNALDIPSIDGLATVEELVVIEDAVADLNADALALTATVDSLSIDLTDLATEVATINSADAIKSDWAPAFDAQVIDFPQVQITTIAGIKVDEDDRDITILPTITSTTVTSTVSLVGILNVSGTDSDTMGDNVVTQTTTSTLYEFSSADDASVDYNHTISATSSWTLID